MEILDKITIKKFLAHRDDCHWCNGKGYVLVIRPDFDATTIREVRPCPRCARFLVRIRE